MKKIAILCILLFGLSANAEGLTEESFNVLKSASADIAVANSNLQTALAEGDFELVKKSVEELRTAVNLADKVVKDIDKPVRVYYDNNWYTDYAKGVLWRQLRDGSVETRPLVNRSNYVIRTPIRAPISSGNC